MTVVRGSLAPRGGRGMVLHSPVDWMQMSPDDDRSGGSEGFARNGCGPALAQSQAGHLHFPPLPRFCPFLDE